MLREWVPILFSLRWSALLVLALALVSPVRAQTDTADLPVPIQRIVVKPDRVAKELEKVQQGTLIHWPLAHFEARLERARKALTAREQKPRLTKATYVGELAGSAIVGTRGEWSVHLTGGAAAVLPLDPLSLALANPRWEQGPPALLGDFDGKSLGLLVPKSGAQTCFFDWSARGTPVIDGIAFNLAIPACALSLFEISLPPDTWLSSPQNLTLVTGPHDSGQATTRLWKVHATGLTQVELAVRKISGRQGTGPLIFARTHSLQLLDADRAAVNHEFQLDIVGGSIAELILDTESELQPFDVSIKTGEVKRYQWEEKAASKLPKGKIASGGGTLRIEFHQPVQGRLQGLRVRSLAAMPPAEWNSPALRVRDAVSRGETVQLQIHPDVPISKWDIGTFQYTQLSTESDGTQSLTLADTAPNTPNSRRPTLSLERKKIDLRTRESHLCAIDAAAVGLQSEIQCTLLRGTLFELNVRMPQLAAGYSIDNLDVQPEDTLREWRRTADGIALALKKPLTPLRPMVVKVALQGKSTVLPTARTVPLPELEIVEANKREGTYDVEVDRALQPQLLSSSVPVGAAPVGQQRTSAYSFTFRDQRFTGSVRVVPRPTQLRWHVQQRIELSDAHANLTTQLEAEPIVGTPRSLDVRFPPGFPPDWKVRAENGLTIHHSERLIVQEIGPHVMALGTPGNLPAALVESALPRGALWRFHLAQPLHGMGRFTIAAALPAGWTDDDLRRLSLQMPSNEPAVVLARIATAKAADVGPSRQTWQISFPVPAHAVSVDQKISVSATKDPITGVTTTGLTQLDTTQLPTEKNPASAFVLRGLTSDSAPCAGVTLVTRPAIRSASALEFCDEANITSFVQSDGQIHHRVRFRLWNWRALTAEVRFPGGQKVVAVKVHDHWRDNVGVAQTDHGTLLQIPIDQNQEFVRYEIVLRDNARTSVLPGIFTMRRLQVEWPAKPHDVQTTLCLERDLTLAQRDNVASLGVPEAVAAQSPTGAWLRRAWTWGRNWLPIDSGRRLDRRDQQNQVVLTAERQLRAQAEKPETLGDALEGLAFHHLAEQCPLIVDRVAMQTLALCADTPIAASALAPTNSRPFWESLGLVYVACPGGALLTSPSRAQQLHIYDGQPSEELDAAVHQAVLHGTDSSATFDLIVAWLRQPTKSCNASTAPGFAVAEYEGAFQEMTQWQLVADDADGELTLLEPVSVTLEAWIVAGCAGIALLLLLRKLQPLSCVRVSLLIALGAVLSFVWSQQAIAECCVLPFAVIAIVGACISLLMLMVQPRAAAAENGNSTVSHQVVTGAAALALTLTLAYSAAAQPAAVRHTVLIVDGPNPTALLTPELVARLDEIENPGSAAAVLTAARYSGVIKDNLVHFEATYDVFSAVDDARLAIPLTGVQLGDQTLLDGAPAFPVVQKSGFALAVPTKGNHQVRLTFTVRLATGNDQVDLKFTIPKLAQNQVSLAWPVPVPAVHCLHCWGEETRTLNAAQAVTRWNGQLGYESLLHLRWPGAASGPGLRTVEVREAHFWDLRADSLSLSSSFQYMIGKGTLGKLTVGLAEGLLPRSIEVQATGTPAIVKHWQIVGKGQQRQLQIELSQPVSGAASLHLDLVPSATVLQQQVHLALPGPLDGKSTSGLLGYRLQATETRSTVQNLSVQETKPVEFEQAWKKQTGRPAPGSATRGYTFQRKGVQAGLDIAFQPFSRLAEANLRWTVHLHHADFAGKFAFTSAADDIAVLDFTVDPALTVADVLGPDVRRWAVSDGVLQVWLRGARKTVELEVVGWRTLPGPVATKRQFVVPAMYPLQARLAEATLFVQPAAGVALDPDATRRLRPLAGEKYRYAVEAPSYDATFWVRRQTMPTDAVAVTRIRGDESGSEVVHTVRLATDRGAMPRLQLEAREWPSDVKIDAPGATIVAGPTRGANRTWSLIYAPGLPQTIAIALRGHLPKSGHAITAIPTVEIDKAPAQTAVITWQGVDIVAGDSGKNLASQPRFLDAASLDGLGSAQPWNVAKIAPGLRVKQRAATEAPKVRIISSATTIVRDEAHGWAHELTAWVHSSEAAELRLRLPGQAKNLRVLLEDRSLLPRSVADQEIGIPLPASPFPRFLRVRWSRAETNASPPLTTATIEGAATVPLSLWVPAGMSAQESRAPVLLEELVAEAELHMEASAILAQASLKPEQNPSRHILARQQAFHASMTQASYLVSAAKDQVADADAWVLKIGKLKDRNFELARIHRYEKQRGSAQKSKKIAWTSGTGFVPQNPGIRATINVNGGSPQLERQSDRIAAAQRTHAEWLLLAGLLFVVLSFFRRGLVLMGALLPEILIAGVAALFWYEPGGVLALAMVALMALIRVWRLLAWWRQAGPVQAEAPASTTKIQHDAPIVPPNA